MSYPLVQTVIVHITEKRLLRILLYEANDLVLPQAVRLILTHPLPYSAHFCCSADSRGQGKAWRLLVRFSAGLSWPLNTSN